MQNEHAELFRQILNEMTLAFEEFRTGDHVLFRIRQKKIVYPANLAYILFTSGSTGFPKGIVHTTDGLSAFLKWCNKEFRKYKCKRFVSVAPLNFDLSIFDVFFPFLNQGTLLLPEKNTVSNPRAFLSLLEKYKTEVIYTTPSYLKLLASGGQLQKYNLKNVKLVLCAGEQLNYGLIRELKQHFKKAVFYNLYGPTETNVCLFHKADPTKGAAEEKVPIGKPCYSNDIKLSGKGELLYKGKLLMKAFIDENGMHKIHTGVWYKTGDLVKKLKGNNYEFIGRQDKMIKRNGFRIEPDEIKKTLLQFRGVTACEVLVVKNDNWRIFAFVVDDGEAGELQLKTFCLQNLPSYMLPDRIISLKEMPLNLNHKADLGKLKEMIS